MPKHMKLSLVSFLTSENFKAFCFNLLFGLLFTALMVAPDIILSFFVTHRTRPNTDTLLLIFTIGFFLSFAKSRKVFYVFWFLFLAMQFIQICHITYFGRYIHPTDIGKLFREREDILMTSFAEAGNLWFIGLAVFLPFGLLLLSYLFMHKRMKTFRFGWMLIILLVALNVGRFAYRNPRHPSPQRYSFHNSFNSFLYYGFKDAWIDDPAIIPPGFYKPYSVKVIEKPGSTNIVLIMGESVNGRMTAIDHYARPTTPFIQSMMADKKHVDAQIGISCGAATYTTSALFFNVSREPSNLTELNKGTANLFRIAKSQGFKTFFITAQSIKASYDIDPKLIDYVAGNETHKDLIKEKRDLAVIDILKSQKLSDKNFIVIQTRSPHAPYESNYAKGSAFDVYPEIPDDRTQNLINTYDNAMLFMDYSLKEIFGYFKTLTPQFSKNYFVFTSDHGEAFGENGLFGHNHMNLANAWVPYISYASDGKKIGVQMPSHYEMGVFLARLMGVDVINPNIEDGVFYLVDDRIRGDNNMLEYKKAYGKIVSEDVTTVSKWIKKKTGK